jgi:ACR3 family arsenite efflux pump ArsB
MNIILLYIVLIPFWFGIFIHNEKIEPKTDNTTMCIIMAFLWPLMLVGMLGYMFAMIITKKK